LEIAKTKVLSFTIILAFILSITVIALPASAQSTSVQTVVLSNEEIAMMKMQNAGWGNYTIYQTLEWMVRESNPSLGNILTSSFLQTLQNTPASSQVLTKQLKDYADWNAIAISTDGSVRTVAYEGSSYYSKQGTSSLDTQLSGVGNFRAVYSSSQTPITTFTAGSTTYNIFAILYIPATSTASTTPLPTQAIGTTQPTPTAPEFPVLSIVPVMLALLFVAVILKQKKPKTLLPSNCC
jgi:hypothetical protein